MSTVELLSKVRDLKELKIMADELQAEITAIEDAIKAEMTVQDVAEIIIDVFKVRWTPVKSSRFDTTALRPHTKSFTTSSPRLQKQGDSALHNKALS